MQMAHRLAEGASWLSRRRTPLLTAVLSGVLFAAALPGGVASWLTWVCLVPVLWVLAGADLSLCEGILIGWLFGLTTFLSVYSFLVATLQRFGGLPLPLALLGYGLLCAGQGTAYAAWAGLTHLCRRLGRMPFVLAAPSALVLVEWLYPSVFPVYLAYGLHGQTPVVQSLDLAGPLGLSFLVALSGAAMAEGLDRLFSRRPVRPWPALLGLTLLHAGNLGYGALRMSEIDARAASAAGHLRVGLVQTNQGSFVGSAEIRQGVLRHQEQSLEAIRAGAEVVVWPESAYNFVITAAMNDVSQSVLGPVDRPVVFGGLRLAPSSRGRRLFHSAFLSDARGRLRGYYDKQRLVPLGEYVPLGEHFPQLYELSPRSGRFSAGQGARLLRLGDLRLAVTICYEDLFPDLVRGSIAEAPQLLVNVSNDSWFGDTREPRAHLVAASFRAVEQRRFLVRATNTGVSAIVDPVGRVLAETPAFERATLVGRVALLEERTLYGRLGDWFGGLVLAVLLAWSVTRRRRRHDLARDRHYVEAVVVGRGGSGRWRPRERRVLAGARCAGAASQRENGMKQRLSRVAVGVFLVGVLGGCFSTDPEPLPPVPPAPTRADVKLLVDPNPVRANYEGDGWYRFKVNLAFSESAGVGFTINTIRVTVSSALSGDTLLDANSPVSEHVAANGSKVLQFTCPQYHMEFGTSAARTRFSASITDDKGNAITLSGQADVLRRGEPQQLP